MYGRLKLAAGTDAQNDVNQLRDEWAHRPWRLMMHSVVGWSSAGRLWLSAYCSIGGLPLATVIPCRCHISDCLIFQSSVLYEGHKTPNQHPSPIKGVLVGGVNIEECRRPHSAPLSETGRPAFKLVHRLEVLVYLVADGIGKLLG